MIVGSNYNSVAFEGVILTEETSNRIPKIVTPVSEEGVISLIKQSNCTKIREFQEWLAKNHPEVEIDYSTIFCAFMSISEEQESNKVSALSAQKLDSLIKESNCTSAGEFQEWLASNRPEIKMGYGTISCAFWSISKEETSNKASALSAQKLDSLIKESNCTSDREFQEWLAKNHPEVEIDYTTIFCAFMSISEEQGSNEAPAIEAPVLSDIKRQTDPRCPQESAKKAVHHETGSMQFLFPEEDIIKQYLITHVLCNENKYLEKVIQVIADVTAKIFANSCKFEIEMAITSLFKDLKEGRNTFTGQALSNSEKFDLSPLIWAQLLITTKRALLDLVTAKDLV